MKGVTSVLLVLLAFSSLDNVSSLLAPSIGGSCSSFAKRQHHHQPTSKQKHQQHAWRLSCKTTKTTPSSDDPLPVLLPTPSLAINYVFLFAILPLASLSFPVLLSTITGFSIDAFERSKYILTLLLAKRVYLYSLALVGVDWCAKRSLQENASLGQRFKNINKEVFGGLPSALVGLAKEEQEAASEAYYEALDDVKGETQAAALPVIVASSLVFSFLLYKGTSMLLLAGGDVNSGLGVVIDADTSKAIAAALNTLVLLSNVGVAFLFTKIELQYALSSFWSSKQQDGGKRGRGGGKEEDVKEEEEDEDSKTRNAASTIGAGALTLAAFASPIGGALWPVQNIVNMCISIAVSRVAFFPSLLLVLLALSGLVFYDVFAVVGTQAFTDGGQSIMEAVARSKMGIADVASSGGAAVAAASSSSSAAASAAASTVVGGLSLANTWRPGLFEVAIGGKISDVLGLADVLFPSLLAGWALRFDREEKRRVAVEGGAVEVLKEEEEARGAREAATSSSSSSSSSLYPSTLAGYALGCFLCEVFQTGKGQPALIFIVPSMTLLLFANGIAQGKLASMCSSSSSSSSSSNDSKS